MWAAIIIVLVIAMVVGPIMLMRPSKRDQYLALLRARARSKNLSVSASSVKDEEGVPCWFYWLAVGQDEEGSDKRVQSPLLLVRKSYAHDLHVAQYYEYAKGSRVPDGWEALIADMPASVRAIELNRHALGVHWNERGGEAVLDEIAARLGQLLRLLP